MSPDLQPLGRALIFFGIVLTTFGLLLLIVPRLPLIGRLPGDIVVQRKQFWFYFPLASCLLASILLSLLLWLAGRFRP